MIPSREADAAVDSMAGTSMNGYLRECLSAMRADWEIPPHVLHAAEMMFRSPSPMLVVVGEQLRVLFNAAVMQHAPTLTSNQLGMALSSLWPAVSGVLRDVFLQVMRDCFGTTKTAVAMEDLSEEFPESEFYWTFACTPVFAQASSADAVLVSLTDCTSRVVSERALRTVSLLGSRVVTCMRDACQLLAEAVDIDACDLPFATIYSRQPDDSFKLECASKPGCKPGCAAPSADSERRSSTPCNMGGLFPAQVRRSGPESRLAVHSTPSCDGQTSLTIQRVEGVCPPHSPAWADVLWHTVEQHVVLKVRLQADGSELFPTDYCLCIPMMAAPGQSASAVLVLGMRRSNMPVSRGNLVRCLAGLLSALLYAGRAREEESVRARALAELAQVQSSAAQRERQLRLTAEAANRSKEQFLAIVSHELRTPLTPALLHAEMIEHDRSLPQTVRESAGTVTRCIRLQSRLVDDLLDVSKLLHDKMSLRLEPCNVHSVVEDAIQIVEPDIDHKRLTLHKQLDATMTTVAADTVRLQQIVWNLLKNAVKFTPNGGTVTLRSYVVEEGSEADTRHLLAVEVADTGRGLEPEEICGIFAPFRQVRANDLKQHQPHFGGLGLGLAIAHSLAILMGGSLTVASPGRDKGATFGLRLPLVPSQTSVETPLLDVAPRLASLNAQDTYALERDMQQPVRPPPGSGYCSDQSSGSSELRRCSSMAAMAQWRPLRILLVEDNALSRRIMSRILSSTLGHQVVEADTCRMAIELALASMHTPLQCQSPRGSRSTPPAQQEGDLPAAQLPTEPFDLILCDIGLPDGTGHQVVEQLQARYARQRDAAVTRGAATDWRPPPPAVAVTGYGMEEDVERSRRSGFRMHLVKPVSVQSVRETIARLCFMQPAKAAGDGGSGCGAGSADSVSSTGSGSSADSIGDVLKRPRGQSNGPRPGVDAHV